MTDSASPPGTPVGGSDRATSAASDVSAIPDALLSGKYRVERVIGEGAFGRVYLARDSRLGRSVAIKELLATRDRTDPAVYERYLDRFEREARAAAIAQHPNIVAVHELAVDRNQNYYLVMEFIEGSDLRNLLTTVHTLPVERAVAITLDVARALDSVHEQDIVHRDLKPANIMLTSRGSAKLTDFGIAQVGTESQRTSVSVGHPGTPLYMSPEQARGTAYLEPGSDLYSLGLVLYEMLAGVPYGRRRQPLGTIMPDLSPQLTAIVDRLIQPDPQVRYQRASDVIADLEQLSSARGARDVTADTIQTVPTQFAGVQTNPSGPPWVTPVPPVPPARPRRPVAAIGAAILVALLAIGGVAVFALHQGGSPTPTPAAAAAKTPAATPVADNTVFTVADGANLIAFSYPKEWTPGTAPANAGQVVYAYQSANPAGQIAVAKESVTASTTLDSYTSDMVARLFREHPGWKTGPKSGAGGSQSVMLGGQDARLVDFIDPTGSAPWYRSTIVSLRDGRAWNLTFGVPQDQADPFQQQTDKLTKSFVFCPASGCTQKQTAPTVAAGAPAATTTEATPTTAPTRPSGVTPTPSAKPPPSATPTFPPQATTAPLTTFTDPNRLIKLQYPATWNKLANGNASQVLFVKGPSGEPDVQLNVYTPTRSIDEDLVAYRNTVLNDPRFDLSVTKFDPPLDTKVGGAPGKSVAFTFKGKDEGPNINPNQATIYYIDHNGKRFNFILGGYIGHRDEIEAMINSVVFLT